MITRRPIFIINGEIDSGKTRFCLRAGESFKKLGWRVSGIASPAVFHEEGKVEIDALDFQSGERRRLAELRKPDAALIGPQTKRWAFSDRTFAWCNSVFSHLSDCDLLIADEVGPLELDRNEGMLAGLLAVDYGSYRLALIVVRTSLVATAQARWPQANTMHIFKSRDIDSHMKTIHSLAVS